MQEETNHQTLNSNFNQLQMMHTLICAVGDRHHPNCVGIYIPIKRISYLKVG